MSCQLWPENVKLIQQTHFTHSNEIPCRAWNRVRKFGLLARTFTKQRHICTFVRSTIAGGALCVWIYICVSSHVFELHEWTNTLTFARQFSGTIYNRLSTWRSLLRVFSLYRTRVVKPITYWSAAGTRCLTDLDFLVIYGKQQKQFK